MARSHSGARCSRFAFMRSADTIHTAAARSISSQVASAADVAPTRGGLTKRGIHRLLEVAHGS